MPSRRSCGQAGSGRRSKQRTSLRSPLSVSFTTLTDPPMLKAPPVLTAPPAHGKAPLRAPSRNFKGHGSGVYLREYVSKRRDVWAAALFLGTRHPHKSGVVGQVQEGVHGLSQHAYNMRQWAPQLGAAAAIGATFSWFWLQLLKLAPRSMVLLCLWLGIPATLGVGSFLLATHYVSGLAGVVFLLLAVVQAMYAYLVRHRVPFAGTILQKVVKVVRLFPSLLWVAYGAVATAVLWLSIWIFGASGALYFGNSAWIVAILVVSLLWTMEVIRNTVRVTVAGTVATYYYQQQSMPPRVTLRSLCRACTTSFGCVCLGSTCVAVLGGVRELVNVVRHGSEDANSCIFACSKSLLSVVDSIIQYFNKWAFVQVAVYGKGFVSAGKDTWDLFKSHGAESLVNDDLTGRALYSGCFLGGCLTSLLCGGYTFHKHHEYTTGVSVISFFIAFYLIYLTLVVVESGVACFYVCYAEDPAPLQKFDPDFYDKMRARHMELLSSE
eukprot:SM000239S08068  [mRNA]  locus=s239:19317:22680:+ [translate_table: standard]